MFLCLNAIPKLVGSAGGAQTHLHLHTTTFTVSHMQHSTRITSSGMARSTSSLILLTAIAITLAVSPPLPVTDIFLASSSEGDTCGGDSAAAQQFHGHRTDGSKGAAYVFSIFGRCSSRHQAQLLTSAEILQDSKPQFPLAAMLSPTCWRNRTFRTLLEQQSITPLCVPRINNVTCRGSRQRGSFFDEHWTKLNLHNLTGLRVAFYLDSDLVVQRNLDSVVRTLLHRPSLMEARTPQGCLDNNAAYTWFNTGVWAVKPNAHEMSGLIAWLKNGSSHCYDGDQSAAMGYWKIPGGSGGRLRSQVLLLHVGYNMKADQGPQACLNKRELNASDLHVVHFSGKQKPFSMYVNKDDLWKAARESYMRHFKKWEVLLGVPSCTEKQLLKTNMGCYS